MVKSDSNSIIWDETIKRESREIYNPSFDEIREIGVDYVLTKKGVVGKDGLYLSKNFVD